MASKPGRRTTSHSAYPTASAPRLICIMQTIFTWNAFFIPLVFTLTATNLRPLSVGMFAFQGEYTSDWTGMAAGALIGIVPIVAVFLALQRYFIEGVAGAIKG